MRDGDVLLHHPYDSFATTVEAFVDQAARDPSVLAIKQTLYRTGGDEAGIVASLVEGRRSGQAGRRARRAEGALRRAGEHRTGPHAGAGGRARRVRPRRAEDARQDPARRAPGGRRHPPLLPRRHRQLQPEDRDASTRTSACSRSTPSSAPTSPSCSTTSPATAARASTAGCSSRRCTCATSLRALIRGAGAARRRDHDEDERARRRRDDRRAVRGVGRGRARSTSSCAASAACGRACPACPRASPCGRSSAATSSTRGSSGSASPATTDTEYVIGSADLMPRNLDRRVEAMLRVTEPRLRARLDEILELNLADDVLAWTLEPDGTWRRSRRSSASRRRCAPGARDRADEGRAASTADRGQDAHGRRVADVVAHRARVSSVDRLDANEAGAVRPSDDPEAVHQARVATRRLRSDLRTFRDFVDARVGERAARASCAGSAPSSAGCATSRCCASGCAPHAALLPDSRADAARARRSAGSTPTGKPPVRAIELLRALRRRATRSCTARWHAAATARGSRPRREPRATDALPQVVVRPRGGSCASAVDDLGATPSDDALHAVRIRAKRCRYAAERDDPVFGDARAAVRARRSPTCRTCSASTRTPSSPTRGSRRPRPSAARRGVRGRDARRDRTRARGRGPRPRSPSVWDGRPRPRAAALAVTHGRRVEAAGGVVTRGRAGAAVEVLVVHRPRYDDWSLPKGKLEPGETDEDAARPRGRGGDRLALRARRGAPAPCATPTGTAARSRSVTGT